MCLMQWGEGYDQFKNRSVKKRFNHKPMILFLEMKIFEKMESEWLVSSRVSDKEAYDVDQMTCRCANGKEQSFYFF